MKKTKSFLLIFCLILPCALLLTESVLYSQNSLYLNNQWIVQKRMMSLVVMGADEYLLTRIPLSQNRLNLGSYFGNQEVVFREPQLLDQIEFKIKVEDQSYLDFTYNRNELGYSGLRFSRQRELPSISFESAANGKFNKTSSIRCNELSAGWHNISILNQSQGLRIQIDGSSFLVSEAPSLALGHIAFRSGPTGAEVDEIILRPHQGRPVPISFRNSKNWLNTFAFNLFLLIIIGSLISKFSQGAFLINSRKALFQWVMISFAAFFCAGAWFCFDYGYYSQRTPVDLGITKPLFPERTDLRYFSVELVRFKIFANWYKLSGGKTISQNGVAQRGYPMSRIYKGPIFCNNPKDDCIQKMPPVDSQINNKNEKLYRILFVGSSQAIGSGAEKLEDSFFVRIHRYLSVALFSKYRLESINASISSFTSTDLLKEYQVHYIEQKPDLVIINLSNNDTSSIQFLATMEEFLKLNQFLGANTLLVEEANDYERSTGLFKKAFSQRLMANHQVLRRLAKQYNIMSLPLHEFINKPENYNKGPLWWDIVHLTTLGQELTSDWLAPQILKVLRSRPPRMRKS